MAAYHKVEVSLNTNAVEVGIPSPQTVNVVVPTIGPAGPTGSVGPAGPTGPQGVPGTGLEVLTTQGDLLYQGASTGQRLPIGTSGQVLKVSNGIPAWGNESGAVTSVNGETGAVVLDGSEIDTSGNDDYAAFFTYEFADGNGIYYPLPDTTLNNKRVYRNITGHHVFFQSLRWHITDGSPNTQNIIESSNDDNAAWPWLSAWSGEVDKAKIADVVGRARSTFLFLGDSVPNTSVSGLGTAATSDSTAFAAASHTHGNLTNAGAIGTTANLPLRTGTNGVIEAGSFGTAAGSFCAGDDARLAAIPPASTATPSALGTAAAGTATAFARADHVHAMPTAADVGAVSSLQLPLDAGIFPPYADGQVLAYDEAGEAFGPISLNIPAVGTPSVAASYSGPIDSGGFVTVTITANTAGTAGNNIALSGNGVDDVDTLLAAWNAANPSNQATLVSGAGGQVVEDGYIINLSGGATNAAASGSITTSGLTQATARILGRTTASAGAVEELTVGSGLTLASGSLDANFAAPPAIGNTTPAAGTFTTLTANNDTEVTDSTKGLVLKSPNNTRWRITINDDGTLSRVALAIMTLLAFAASGMAQVRDMVTDTNGNIVTGRTNELTFTNNLLFAPLTNAESRTALISTNGALTAGNPPSGAADNGALLTADGAGSSSFVASRVQRVTLTNSFSVTNTSDLTVTNGNVPTMTVDLEANSLYVARWSVLLTCGAEGAKLEAVAGAGTNGIISQSVAGRLGRPSFSYGDTYFITSGGRQGMSLIGFSGGGFTGGVTNGVFNGIAQFRTGASNTTLFWRFSQNSASNVATTLLSNSIFYVEKLSP